MKTNPIYYKIFKKINKLIFKKMLQITLLLVLPFVFSHNRPIMGLMTLPSTASLLYPEDQYSYFGAGYVKFLEMAGIRVVPIPYDTDPVEIEKLFHKINGILIPGGSPSLWVDEEKMLGFSNMTLTSKYLLELVIKANLNGDYFPIWGTCLGLEMLILDITGDSKTLDIFNSENHHGNLLIINEKSRVFEGMSEELKLYSETGFPAYFSHKYGKQYNKFVLDEVLTDFFEINAVSKDLNGVWFVSSAEGKKFPIYISQFHPEMNPFEWKTEDNVNHSAESIAFTEHIANFIAREARKNDHKFVNEEEEEKYLIYNYNPVKIQEFYEQVYFFENRK